MEDSGTGSPKTAPHPLRVSPTPGPWSVHEEGRIGKSGPAPAFIEVRAGRSTICTFFPHAGVGGVGVQTSLANAHLTATLPDLVEALREAEAGLLFAGADKTIPDGDFVPSPTLALRAVRSALSKAGE